MNNARRIPQLITTVVFVALLGWTVVISKGKAPINSDAAERKESSLQKYGFYLEPVNSSAGIHFKHESPDVDPKLKHIERQIASH